jgi:hypothetical protein
VGQLGVRFSTSPTKGFPYKRCGEQRRWSGEWETLSVTHCVLERGCDSRLSEGSLLGPNPSPTGIRP